MSPQANQPKLAIGIPTRNRVDLAKTAIQSVLEWNHEAGPDVEVIISDNSTDLHQVEELRNYVGGLNNGRARLIRPQGDLDMVSHWNFLVDSMLGSSGAPHFLFLTDRMFFKENALGALLRTLWKYAYPDLLSYPIDTLKDLSQPYSLELRVWSGERIRLSSASVLRAVSQGMLCDYLPRMLNSAVSRRFLVGMKATFGDVFGSFAPDFAFCFRSLDTLDQFMYLDKPLIVQHGLQRSNGRSASRGVETTDSQDFFLKIRSKDRGFHFCTPIPGVNTPGNAIIHEYLTAQRASKSGKFPQLDLAGYLTMLWEETLLMEDPDVRAKAKADILAFGGAPAFTDRHYDKSAAIEAARCAYGDRSSRLNMPGLEGSVRLTTLHSLWAKGTRIGRG